MPPEGAPGGSVPAEARDSMPDGADMSGGMQGDKAAASFDGAFTADGETLQFTRPGSAAVTRQGRGDESEAASAQDITQGAVIEVTFDADGAASKIVIKMSRMGGARGEIGKQGTAQSASASAS